MYFSQNLSHMLNYCKRSGVKRQIEIDLIKPDTELIFILRFQECRITCHGIQHSRVFRNLHFESAMLLFLIVAVSGGI